MTKKRLTIPQYDTLALLIQNTRIYRGMTKEELARLSAVSVKTITRYESGQIDIDSEQYASVSKTLGLLKTKTIYEALGIDISDSKVW